MCVFNHPELPEGVNFIFGLVMLTFWFFSLLGSIFYSITKKRIWHSGCSWFCHICSNWKIGVHEIKKVMDEENYRSFYNNKELR